MKNNKRTCHKKKNRTYNHTIVMNRNVDFHRLTLPVVIIIVALYSISITDTKKPFFVLVEAFFVGHYNHHGVIISSLSHNRKKGILFQSATIQQAPLDDKEFEKEETAEKQSIITPNAKISWAIPIPQQQIQHQHSITAADESQTEIIKDRKTNNQFLKIHNILGDFLSNLSEDPKSSLKQSHDFLHLLEKTSSLLSSSLDEPPTILTEQENENGLQEKLQDRLNKYAVQCIQNSSFSSSSSRERKTKFKLILSILESCISFVSLYNDSLYHEENYENQKKLLLKLNPQIFRSAIEIFGKDPKVGYSKLRKTWSIYQEAISMNPPVCLHPTDNYDATQEKKESSTKNTTNITTKELNSMIHALRKKTRYRAALDLFYENKDWVLETTTEDTFTICALLDVLNDSTSDITSSSRKTSEPWQWKEAVSILHEFESTSAVTKSKEQQDNNNYVYSKVLKLIDQISPLSSDIETTERTMYILSQLEKNEIDPDVVTCTQIITLLSGDWKAAYELFNAMIGTSSSPSLSYSESLDDPTVNDNTQISSILNSLSLPKPNKYTYSAILTVLAKHGQMDLALNILNHLRMSYTSSIEDDTSKGDTNIINTWVYNCAISACSANKILSVKEKYEKAMSLVELMEYDNKVHKKDTLPNTITYNTILVSLIDNHNNFDSLSDPELDLDIDSNDSDLPSALDSNWKIETIFNIFEIMKEKNIQPSVVTYHNAILGSNGIQDESNTIPRRIYQMAIKAVADSTSSLLLSSDLPFLLNSALYAYSTNGNIQEMLSVLSDYYQNEEQQSNQEDSIRISSSSLFLLLRGLCRGGDTRSALKILQGIIPSDTLLNKTGVKDISIKLPKYNITISSASLATSESSLQTIRSKCFITLLDHCIVQNDYINEARTVLKLYKEYQQNHQVSSLSSRLIVLSCSKNAIEQAKVETKNAMLSIDSANNKGEDEHNEYANTYDSMMIDHEEQQQQKRNPKPKRRGSRLRARTANELMKIFFIDGDNTTNNNHANAMASVAKAFASAGMYNHSISLLKQIHEYATNEIQTEYHNLERQSLIAEENHDNTVSSSSSYKTTLHFVNELPSLHYNLLACCAKGGKVNIALKIADEIQYLNRRFFSQLKKMDKAAAYEHDDENNIRDSMSLSSMLLSTGMIDGSTKDSQQRTINITQNESNIVDNRNDNGSSTTKSSKNAISSKIVSSYYKNICMKSEYWVLILVAASKARQWRVCLGTLQFLQKYIEKTNPNYYSNDNTSTSDQEKAHRIQQQNNLYDKLSKSLSLTIKCLETCKQYAWTLRVIDDWIKWSGRRPRKDAIISTLRSFIYGRHLRLRGRQNNKPSSYYYRAAEQHVVIDFIQKVIDVPATHQSPSTSDLEYERSIYTYAVTALYKNQLYEYADEIYLKGVSQGFLPWSILSVSNAANQEEEETLQNSNAPLELDLHGMSLPIARSAVRTALQQEVLIKNIIVYKNKNGNTEENSPSSWTKDVIVITGRGANSSEKFRPILRPEVQRMLTEEFYPPLGTVSVPNNMGALQIPASDIDNWIKYQKQETGVRLLAVAELLQTITSKSQSLLASSLQNRLKTMVMEQEKEENKNKDTNNDDNN